MNLLSFLSAVNPDGKTSITNLAVMVTLGANVVQPSWYSLVALALAFANYNAKRFAQLYFGREDTARQDKLTKLEQEVKALISSNELRKMTR